MDLDDRKIKILEAVVNDYIVTGDPVASRSIAKKYDLGISSATIRNEMSDLEELGLIKQPHTSSGRIPSDKGYRFYVNRILSNKDINYSEIDLLKEVVFNNINKIDYLMKETAKIVSHLTNYVTLISKPQSKQIIINQIQLMNYNSNSILLIVILNENIIKNKQVLLNKVVETNYLYKFSILLNDVFSGKEIHNVNKEKINLLKKKLDNDLDLIIPVIDALISIVKAEQIMEIYTYGIDNLLSYPEFEDINKAKEIFKAIEEKELLVSLLGDDADDNIQIVIGSENSVEQLESCTIIKSKYKISDNSYGKIGIIAPKRMDYTQAITTVDNIVKNISNALDTIDKKR